MKLVINEIKIIPYGKKGLYTIYVNGESQCIASAGYASRCVKEFLLNSTHEETINAWNTRVKE